MRALLTTAVVLISSLALSQSYTLVSSTVHPNPYSLTQNIDERHIVNYGLSTTITWNISYGSYFWVAGSTEPCPWSGLFESLADNDWTDTDVETLTVSVGHMYRKQQWVDHKYGSQVWTDGTTNFTRTLSTYVYDHSLLTTDDLEGGGSGSGG